METKNVVFHIGGNQYNSDFQNQHTFKIWQELSKPFSEYHIFARSQDMLFREFKVDNIHLHLIPSLGSHMTSFLFLSWLLPLYIAKFKPNYLISQCPVMGGLASSFCSKVFKIPLLVELHGTHYFKPSRSGLKGILEHNFYKIFSKITFNQATKIRLLSNHMLEDFLSIYGNKLRDKAIIIPVRVDLNKFRKKKSSTIGSTVKVINVGRLCDNKNQLGLLKAIKDIEYDVEITLVGSGEKRNDIENYARSLPSNISVIFSGQVSHEELNDLLNQSDIYIHYAKSEGTPRAIIEAMATGLPVVVSDAGFMNNLLLDGLNSFIVDINNPSQLINRIEQLITSEVKRTEISKNGLEMVYNNFEWHTVFELYRNHILGMKR